MAIVVEDGTGLADAESYASVADADTYHAKFGTTAWAALTESKKETNLRIANRYIAAMYDHRWTGSKRTSTQALAWPQVYAYDVHGYQIPSNVIPDALKDAACELALKAESDDLLPDISEPGTVGAEKVKVGPIEIQTEYQAGKGQLKKYSLVQQLLAPLLRPIGQIGRA